MLDAEKKVRRCCGVQRALTTCEINTEERKMQIIEEEITIPARTEKMKKYVASDGTEFTCRETCELYEERKEIESNDVWRYRISNIDDFYDESNTTLFFIQSQADYDFVLNSQGPQCGLSSGSNKFEDFGVGWYMYQWIDDGSIHGLNTMRKLDNYITSITKDLEDWKLKIALKIDEKAKERRMACVS